MRNVCFQRKATSTLCYRLFLPCPSVITVECSLSLLGPRNDIYIRKKIANKILTEQRKLYRVFIKYCVFFLKILKYFGLYPFSVFPRCQFVYTQQKTSRKPALQQNWQSSEKSPNKEKNTITPYT